MTARVEERKLIPTINQSCAREKGKGSDGQHRHTISPGQESHPPADNSCQNRISANAYEHMNLYYYFVTGEDE
jgi:hypothetical protein